METQQSEQNRELILSFRESIRKASRRGPHEPDDFVWAVKVDDREAFNVDHQPPGSPMKLTFHGNRGDYLVVHPVTLEATIESKEHFEADYTFSTCCGHCDCKGG